MKKMIRKSEIHADADISSRRYVSKEPMSFSNDKDLIESLERAAAGKEYTWGEICAMLERDGIYED